ncbi:hypothetical protein D3C87_2077940 [compost metagenome]
MSIIYLASHIENLRALARQRGAATFADIAAQDRRRGARRLAPVIQAAFPTPAEAEAKPSASFASRAARRFPRQA